MWLCRVGARLANTVGRLQSPNMPVECYAAVTRQREVLVLCRPGVRHQIALDRAAVWRPAGRRRSSARPPPHKKCQKYCSLIRKRCVDTNRFGLVCPTLHVPAPTVILIARPSKVDESWVSTRPLSKLSQVFILTIDIPGRKAAAART